MSEMYLPKWSPAHYQTLEYERVKQLLVTWSATSKRPLAVLDYGFGTGRYLGLFASMGFVVAGVDINEQYLRWAAAEGYDVRHESRFDNLDQTFDVIFLGHLIEHLGPDELAALLPRLISKLSEGGRLVMITPLLGERFYHDFSHVRPYYPQSIRHAFGQSNSPLSYGPSELIKLVDIYFFKDPYRTRSWRSFYLPESLYHRSTNLLNRLFDQAWRLSAGKIGVASSWLGVYMRSDLSADNNSPTTRVR